MIKRLKMKAIKLWLYLARRDLKGIRILTIFLGKTQPPVRVTDLSILQMPITWQNTIEKIIFDNRMMWEPWIESAETYDELRSKLKKRGYTEVPISGKLEFSKTDEPSPPTINNSVLPLVKSMTRKKKMI